MATFPPRRKTAGTAGGLNQDSQRGRTELPCCPASKAGRRGACGAERRHAVPGENADHRAAFDYAENTDCFVLINAKDNRSLGEYYLNDSGLFVVPDPWKPAIDTDRLGSFIANEEQGTFTDYGYILRTSDEWQRVHEGQPVPEEYRVMAYPAPEILREESKVQPEAATLQRPRSLSPPFS